MSHRSRFPTVWTAIPLVLLLSLAACGSRQRTETTEPTTPPPPPQPTAYPDRVLYELRQDGIDVGRIACNDRVLWAPRLRDDAEAFAGDLEATIAPLMRRRIRESDREMVREQVIDLAISWFSRAMIIQANANNLGAVVVPAIHWTDADGRTHPLVFFHSATTPYAQDSDSCFRSLIEHGHVAKAINLYDGNVPLRDQLDAEAAVAESLDVEYVDISQGDLRYRGWRDVLANPDAPPEQRAEAAERVTALLRDIILPQPGQTLRGNIFFHCAGGMHRSAVIAGIIARCLGGQTDEQVLEAMRYHSGYVNEARPGGFEQPLYDFVRTYDCAQLNPSTSEEAAAAEQPPEEPEQEANQGETSEEQGSQDDQGGEAPDQAPTEEAPQAQ